MSLSFALQCQECKQLLYILTVSKIMINDGDMFVLINLVCFVVIMMSADEGSQVNINGTPCADAVCQCCDGYTEVDSGTGVFCIQGKPCTDGHYKNVTSGICHRCSRSLPIFLLVPMCCYLVSCSLYVCKNATPLLSNYFPPPKWPILCRVGR